MLSDVLRREIGSVDCHPRGALPTQSRRSGNRKVHARWVRVGYVVEQQCRLMRKGDVFWPLAGLRPQHCLTVLSETI